MSSSESIHAQVEALAVRLKAAAPLLQIGEVEKSTEVAASSFVVRTGNGFVLSVGSDPLGPAGTYAVVRTSGGAGQQLPFEQEFIDGSGESTELDADSVEKLVRQYAEFDAPHPPRQR